MKGEGEPPNPQSGIINFPRNALHCVRITHFVDDFCREVQCK
jgi:hypothetical protein